MVERVVNMRKLAPPNQHNISNQNNASEKSQDNSGFGRLLSKKLFNMALRHLMNKKLFMSKKALKTGNYGNPEQCQAEGSSGMLHPHPDSSISLEVPRQQMRSGAAILQHQGVPPDGISEKTEEDTLISADPCETDALRLTSFGKRLCVLASRPLNQRNEQSRLLEEWNRVVATCSTEGENWVPDWNDRKLCGSKVEINYRLKGDSSTPAKNEGRAFMAESKKDHQLVTIKEGGNMTFQYPTLTSSNYPIWSLRIKAIFRAHGIWEAIDPRVDVEPRKDNSAIVYLYQSLPEDLVLQVAHCTRAKEIWDAIKTRHLGVERVMEARLQTLKAEFEAARMKESEKIDDFAAKLSGIASRSASLGTIIEETTLVRKILTALPERFLTIAATIEQLVDLKTVNFQEIVGQDWAAKQKQDRGVGQGRGTQGRGRGRGRSGGRGRGSGRGQSNREEAHFGEKPKKDRSKLQCFRCDGYGHFSADCPTRKEGEQANLAHANPTHRHEEDGPTLLMAIERIHLSEDRVFPQRYDSNTQETNVWYLDTGATNHMTGNKGLFSNLNTEVEGTVRFGDNSCVKIERKGSILLECKTKEQRLLTDVLYIPHLKSNILSIGQAEEGGCEILIKHGTLTMFEPSGATLIKVQRSPNRLYKAHLKTGTPVCLKAEITDPAWLWHTRLGHTNFDTIRKISTEGMVKGVPSIKHPAQLCEARLAGKHSRESFPEQTFFRATWPLEQVYAHLCGPLTPATQAGNKYIFLLVDDCSRFMWAYMLKSKDEALDRFKKFKAEVENCYERKIKALRTDRGGEFDRMCEKAGITRQLTNPYTPQQNGIVERRNRTILNMTRSILKAMRMPQALWAEAVRHSVYLLNRLPTKALKGKTPYEVMKGHKPNLNHLKVFGCIGHVKTPQNLIKKLDSRKDKKEEFTIIAPSDQEETETDPLGPEYRSPAQHPSTSRSPTTEADFSSPRSAIKDRGFKIGREIDGSILNSQGTINHHQRPMRLKTLECRSTKLEPGRDGRRSRGWSTGKYQTNWIADCRRKRDDTKVSIHTSGMTAGGGGGGGVLDAGSGRARGSTVGRQAMRSVGFLIGSS
ncbi:hypothetical protein E3N88_17752 [Mikania micrantha]|uniref:Integrase catalytic domain-containing protein n=1 Tax=Mikania micrantha TaxID=192012 RepID=A0A5N6NSR5_9ASTR|nr:hypothetical protein E3N88_17752 [Mikania micrantha]